MKNKQDWGDLLDYITKNFRLQSKDGKYYESDLLIELGTIFKKQLTKAKEEAVEGVLALPKQDYKPVGGLSNQRFIFVNSIELYLKSLEDKK